MARMTGGEALVKTLRREGTRVVFGLPGVQLYGVMAALREEKAVRFIATRHEQAIVGDAGGERLGGCEIDLQRLQVSVIDAEEARFQFERAVELLPRRVALLGEAKGRSNCGSDDEIEERDGHEDLE